MQRVEDIVDVELDCAGTYIRKRCEIIFVFHWQINKLRFLALQHSAHAAIHGLAARAMFLEAAVLLLSIFEISSSDTRVKRELGLLPLFLCFVEQNEVFRRRKYERGVQWYFSWVDVQARIQDFEMGGEFL